MISHKSKKLLIVLVLVLILELLSGCQNTSHVHSWQNATCAEPKICTTCGTTSGNALGHSWQSATCTEAKFCDRCGATSGNALGHTWQSATCTKAKYCEKCGSSSGSASGHTWLDATCSAPKTCATCGLTNGYSLGHDWKEATYNSPKTCRRCRTTQGSVKELTQVSNPVYTVIASSTYSGDNATHGAYNLLDGDLKTNWTEGVKGDGELEYVDFYFYDTYLITGLTIYAGNHASATAYERNSRPKEIGLVFNDTAVSYTLRDQMVGQTIIFDEPVWTDCLTIGILSVYQGSKWDDTVISEVSFTAYK